jgi:RNA polymerase sigma-70 factor (ECF subfamily)
MAKVATDRDRAAFSELFDYFGPRIKALMLKAGADHALAEDLVQDVMMTVWRKVELYVPERGSVGSWVFTIARNARIDRLRRGSSRPYEDIDDLELMSADRSAEEETFASQQAARVADAMADLPGEQRRIVELAYVHDLPQSRIAAELDLPLGTVKSRLRLAYAKLRLELEDVK